MPVGNPSENRHHRPNFNKISPNNPESLDCRDFAKQNLPKDRHFLLSRPNGKNPLLTRNIGLRRCGVPKDTAASRVPARKSPINIPPLAFRHLTRPCWNGIACSLPAHPPRRRRPAASMAPRQGAAGCLRRLRTTTARAFWRASIRVNPATGGCPSSTRPRPSQTNPPSPRSPRHPPWKPRTSQMAEATDRACWGD